jgi:uncharacterized membrane protein (DUF4010 family)
MDLDIARNFMVALLIGALVGIDRERHKASDGRQQLLGGIRTHMLLALLGASAVKLALLLAMPWLFVAMLLVVGGALLAPRLAPRPEGDAAHSLSGELAALAVFVLGAMAVAGPVALAVALGVTISALLAYKQPLHGWVQRLDTQDLFAALKLLIASFIVLPLLPDRTLDPWQALNPYRLWLLVVLTSALSLSGYLAVRWLGSAHGSAITGLAGGLVSSTATTLAFARSSRTGADVHALAAGILLSWLVMFVRVLAIVGVLNRPLLASAWPAPLVMGLCTALLAGWHYRLGRRAGGRAQGQPVQVSNPFSLSAAARFGALFAVVLLGVALAQRHTGAVGMYGVAALAGTVDVDAITLSMADPALATAAPAQAAQAIAVAVISNTLVKTLLVLLLGSVPLRRQLAWGGAVLLGAGAVTVGAFGP